MISSGTFGMALQLTDGDSGKGPLTFGEWLEPSIDWANDNLDWLFNIIEWPFYQIFELLVGGDGRLLSLPRLLVVVAVAALAYLSGDVRRCGYVGGALGILALMGTSVWRDGMYTLSAVVVVLLFAAPLVALSVWFAAKDSRITIGLRQFALGWGWVHPFALLLPAIWFFGIGSTIALILTTVAITPFAVRVATESASGTLLRRTRVGLQAGVQPALLVILFLGIVGIGGLSFTLSRSLNNMDFATGIDAGIAAWLVGFTLWMLFEPWSTTQVRNPLDQGEGLNEPVAQPIRSS